jgi:acyl-CoA synthetase (AMP-forming)/AMP-acid ligase II/peptidoglycan/LPS O-acetylase OafA/YrhL
MLVESIRKANPTSIAAVDSTGKAVSYEQLLDSGSKLAIDIGRTPQLVLLEASSTVDWLVGYVSCLIGGHPVIIAPKGSKETIQKLSKTFDVDIQLLIENGYVPQRYGENQDKTLHGDLAVLLSTSGSTGSAKCVKLSNENLFENAASICEYLSIKPENNGVANLPTHYSYGLSVVNSHLHAGATVLLTDDSVIDDDFWNFLRKYEADSFQGVPHVYDLLSRVDLVDKAPPSLRYFTQAGGRLAPAQVTKFSDMAKKNGWKFYVMYGQTEATARMAYMPPDQLANNPTSIGVAIPGGKFSIVSENGELCGPGVVGELVYVGPNVMMGYAKSWSDLGADPIPNRLKTGDLAKFDTNGFYYIAGRRSRFIKVFGNRVGLDDVENIFSELGVSVVVTGCDNHLMIATTDSKSKNAIRQVVEERLKIPNSYFSIETFEKYPLMASGKIDYQKIRRLAEKNLLKRRGDLDDGTSVIKTGEEAAKSVMKVFSEAFNDKILDENSTFRSLGGDSLNYVQVSSGLVKYIPTLPANWDTLSVSKLQELAEFSPQDSIGEAKPVHDNFDTLRAIACLMVVLFHVVGMPESGLQQREGGLRWFVDSFDYFRMPLFMAMAGFFYVALPVSSEGVLRYLNKRFLYVMIPAIFVSTVYWVVRRIVYDLNESLIEVLMVGYLHVWFLYALMLITAFVVVVDWLFKPNTWFWICVVLFSPVLAESIPYVKYLSVNQAMNYLCFFALGVLIGRQPDFLNNQIVIVSSFILAALSLCYHQLSILNADAIPDWQFMRYVGGCSCVICMIKLVPKIGLLSSLGVFTYAIYLWHPFANAAVRFGMSFLGIENIGVLVVVGFLAGVSLPVLLYVVISRLPKSISIPIIGR